jgi:antitoxin component of MazEF toxin-antitoxin module
VFRRGLFCPNDISSLQTLDLRANISTTIIFEARLEPLMHTLKLTQIGNSVGVIFPNEALAKLRFEIAQSVSMTETPEGLVLTPYDPALDEQIQAGRAFMREFRDTFHQLAK